MFGLLLLATSVAMYLVWRLWLWLHGTPYRPAGRWETRTAAAHAYLAAQPPLRRSQKVMLTIALTAQLVFVLALIAWLAAD